MPFKAPVAPKCNRCDKSAYPAESVAVSINAVQLTYHKACFKCSECQLTLTLKTYKVSDFGDEEVFCNKCVPKQAPSQNSESIETDRTRKAAALFRDVGIVNEQLRGSEETKGVGQSGTGSAEGERLKQAGALSTDVGLKNEQVSKLYEKSTGIRTPEVVRATPGKFKQAGGPPEAISLYQRLGNREGDSAGKVRTETYPVGSAASKEATEEAARSKLLVKTLEADLEAVQVKCSSLEGQLEVANAKIATLESDNASMHASDFAAKKARKASIKRSAESGVEGAAAEAKADEVATAAAEAAAEAAVAAAASKSAIEADLVSQTAKVAALSAQLEAVMAKHDDECARADASEKEARGLAARVAELTAAASEGSSAAADQVYGLTAENSELKAMNSDLEEKLQTSQEALAALGGGGCSCTIS